MNELAELNSKVQSLGFACYDDYLKSDHWKGVQRQMYRGRPRCAICHYKKKLNIHHKTYERLGREQRSDLVILCERCHRIVHRMAREWFLTLWKATMRLISEARWQRRKTQRKVKKILKYIPELCYTSNGWMWNGKPITKEGRSGQTFREIRVKLKGKGQYRPVALRQHTLKENKHLPI